MTDQATCGFNEAIAGLCREARSADPGAIRCPRHEDPRFSVCVGCAGRAVGECGQQNGAMVCHQPLCLNCSHLDGNAHGRPELADPASTTTGPAKITMDVRKELIAVVAVALEGCEERGMLTFPAEDYSTRAAGVAVDSLISHVTLKVLSGLAGAQE